MAELLQNSDYIDFTPEQLKTPEGIAKLNTIIRKLAQDMPGDGEGIKIYKGYGTPEAFVTAGISSLYMRIDGSAGTTLYQKQSGTGNTGWVAVPGGSGSYSLTVEEQDGAPSVADVVKIKFPNGKVTDDGSGVVSITVGTGTVTGTGTDNHVMRWDGTGAAQDSVIIIDDTGYMRAPATTGYYISSTADPLAGGGALMICGGTATLEVNNNIKVYQDSQFGSSNTFFPTMTLGGGTNSGLFVMQGNYSSNNAAIRWLNNYILEMTKYVFAYELTIGQTYLGSLTAAPTNGLLVQGKIIVGGNVQVRVVVEADATSITPNADTSDITKQANTQALGTLTINAPSGTPDDGQEWILRIKSTNVQTFSWNAIYRGGTVALPTVTTGGSKTDYFKFIYNSTDTKWDFISATYGF